MMASESFGAIMLGFFFSLTSIYISNLLTWTNAKDIYIDLSLSFWTESIIRSINCRKDRKRIGICILIAFAFIIEMCLSIDFFPSRFCLFSWNKLRPIFFSFLFLHSNFSSCHFIVFGTKM